MIIHIVLSWHLNSAFFDSLSLIELVKLVLEPRPAGPSTEVVDPSSSRKNELARSSLDSLGRPPRGSRATPRLARLRTPSGEQILDTSKDEIPTISLGKDALKTTWKVTKSEDDKFVVTGEKIEKFARRTDLNNYASVNRLRDILKKMGIRAELTSQGAKPDSIISIAGKEFTLVEDW